MTTKVIYVKTNITNPAKNMIDIEFKEGRNTLVTSFKLSFNDWSYLFDKCSGGNGVLENVPDTILAPFILGNRNIKSRIRRFDWLLESLESSVVIGCFF